MNILTETEHSLQKASVLSTAVKLDKAAKITASGKIPEVIDIVVIYVVDKDQD